jgi:hypothetical protein
MNIPTELVQAILNYLGSKPYAEVFQLISAVQAEAAKQVTEEKAD